MKALKKTGTIVISVLLWLVILVAALYAFTTIATRDNQNVSSLLGYTPLVVKSDSMAPTFSAGDLIFIKNVTHPPSKKAISSVSIRSLITNMH